MAETNETTKVEKSAKADKPAKKKSNKPSIFARIKKFFKDLFSEMKKVSWSPWKSVKTNTFVVAIAVVSMGAAIGILDYLFSGLLMLLGGLIS